MDCTRLEFVCEVSRTVERFGLLGGKLNMPDNYLNAFCCHLVITKTDIFPNFKLLKSVQC